MFSPIGRTGILPHGYCTDKNTPILDIDGSSPHTLLTIQRTAISPVAGILRATSTRNRSPSSGLTTTEGDGLADAAMLTRTALGGGYGGVSGGPAGGGERRRRRGGDGFGAPVAGAGPRHSLRTFAARAIPTGGAVMSRSGAPGNFSAPTADFRIGRCFRSSPAIERRFHGSGFHLRIPGRRQAAHPFERAGA